MKIAAALLSILCLFAAPVREGSFDIRFEPTAKLQTNVEVPFEISVKDSRKQPLVDAHVVMQIELTDHSNSALVKAPAKAPLTEPGVYLAKPTFPVPGQWNVQVRVQRNDVAADRTIQFNVVE